MDKWIEIQDAHMVPYLNSLKDVNVLHGFLLGCPRVPTDTMVNEFMEMFDKLSVEHKLKIKDYCEEYRIDKFVSKINETM